MGAQAQAAFSVKSWDENTWNGRPSKEVNGAKLTRAAVTYTYTGAITGESALEYLMSYNADGTTGSFVALELVSGSVDGKTGSFVLLHNGTFDATSVSGTVTVAPGSGTGALTGLRGTGAISLVGHQESYPFTLEYDLDA